MTSHVMLFPAENIAHAAECAEANHHTQRNARRTVIRRNVMASLVLLLTILPVQAEDARIAEEIVAPQPPVIPLREAIGEQPLREAIDSGRYTYAGNAKCRLCHRDFFLGRKQDVHDHAFERLIGTEHENNSRCLACHTTGHGVKGGFTSIEQTPRLMNVQCEGCHGPGSEHIRRNAKGGFLAGTDRPEILQKMCLSCHNKRWNRAFTDFHKAYDSYKSAKPGESGTVPVTSAK